jgi:hypothetical protein
MPSVPPPQARRRWQARRRRGRARPGKQATGIVDWTHPRSIGGGGPAGEVTGERRRRRSGGAPAGTRTAVREGTGLNHMLHGELPWDLGKALGRSPGLESRRRGELDGGGPAAAAGTRVLANMWLGLINKRLGEVLWSTRQSLGTWVSEDGDWKGVHTGRRQWRTTVTRVEARAREGWPGLAYKRGGGRLG